ncbi:hypothetical protein VP01_5875g1 [Puccinia sorghi]|uniref:Uncharacterized protein n=1 Tax=Puccinia sorghi TaxID=27349 RepID=A0A0L6UJZ9_9BASI|nr:hypothetical protein VP01_5875g1 [Puccinia sorghi]
MSGKGAFGCNQYFSTQSFVGWLACFLERPGIGDLLKDSLSTTQISFSISDVRDSNMWKTLKTSDNKPLTGFSGNLLAIYYLNHNTGSTQLETRQLESIFLLEQLHLCLNLPAHLQASHDNIFLDGLIPGPSEPSVIQTNHCCD